MWIEPFRTGQPVTARRCSCKARQRRVGREGNKGSMGHKLLANAEIPRLQRRISAPSLAQFAAMPEHDMAIVQAYATGCYCMKEIAETLDIQYATASRTVKKTD